MSETSLTLEGSAPDAALDATTPDPSASDAMQRGQGAQGAKGGRATFARVLELDSRLLVRITRVRFSPLTWLMRVLCRAHDPDVLAMLIAVLVFCGPAASRVATHLGAAVISTSLLVLVVKRTVRRTRPSGDLQAQAPPDRFSFPSGHTAAAFALAVAMYAVLPAWGPLFVVTALLVGWGRMYLGVHYPIDVLAGACIGLTTGTLVALA